MAEGAATPAKELSHLESHVREALDGHRRGRPDALASIRRHHPRLRGQTVAKIRSARFTLADARLVVAREHGFPDWKTIRAEALKGAKARWNLPAHERIDDPAVRQAVEELDQGNEFGLANLLTQLPGIATRLVRVDPTGPFAKADLLSFAATVFPRRRSVPPHLPRLVAQILAAGKPARARLEAALALAVDRPWKGREDVQCALVRTLIEAGARPQTALDAAAAAGAVRAARELIRAGAKVDVVAAAALGPATAVKRLAPHATRRDRQRALLAAALHGRLDAARTLVAHGADPSAFNPPPLHTHSTPLHEAAWAGHGALVKLFIREGADLGVHDKAHDATPLGWAEYAGHKALAQLLRAAAPRKKKAPQR